MKRVCYWCNTDMGQKEGQGEGGIFYSICDGCARRLRLDERLPELLQAVADLRKQNTEKQNQTPSFLTDPRLNLLENIKEIIETDIKKEY